MTPILDPANRKRIATFKTIVADLKSGKHYPITRLTPIKLLCKEPTVAAAFTKYLASIAAENLSRSPCPESSTAKSWQTFQRLAREGMQTLDGSGVNQEVRRVLTAVRNSQNVIQHQRWADVRRIECKELLQIELALSCLLPEDAPSRLAYDAARQHAERYDMHSGTGLLPSSAESLEQIIAFWEGS